MKKEEALKLVATSIKKTKNQKNGQNPIIDIVSIKTIARLWAGMGCCNEIIYYLNNNDQKKMSIVCKEISMPSVSDGELSCGDARKKNSYIVEKNFYDKFAAILRNNQINVPEGLYTISTSTNLFICMSKLQGTTLTGLNIEEASKAVCWAAKLHAFTWQKKAETFVETIGLQKEGTYWYLSTRMEELENIQKNKSFESRLFLAAHAIDKRLKKDPFQSIVHGDFKANNMVCDENNNLGMCDFQYCGKGCCLKDICYMIACYCNDDNNNHDLHHHHMEGKLFEIYYNELKVNLDANTDSSAKIPSYSELLNTVDLCFLDLCRWMAGWGFWGNSFLIPRAKMILNKIDKGEVLKDAEEYVTAIDLTYPLY